MNHKRDFRTIETNNNSWLMLRNKVLKVCLLSLEIILSMVTWILSKTLSILKETSSPLNQCLILRIKRNHLWLKENPFLSLFLCKTLTNKMTLFMQETNFSKKTMSPKRKRNTNFKNLIVINFF